MAKEANHSPILLFGLSALLLSAGWLMASFPIFIFIGLAPLFALTDRATNTTVAWEKMEWALLALTISFLAARSFDFSYVVSSLVFAILFTLSLMGQVWVRQTLGNRAGKMTIIFFWLAMEYLILKTIPEKSIFLADALRLQPHWMRWNIHTGYLGASCWILISNVLVYESFLSKNPFRWYWIVLTVLFIASPVAYSYFLNQVGVSRIDMMSLYSGKSMIEDVAYLARGEFVVRTATWLSTLILLATFVRNQTTNR